MRRDASSTSSRSAMSTRTNHRSGTLQVEICSCWRGAPYSRTRAPEFQSETTARARPARAGGTNASASTGGTPSRASSAASATRTRRFHGQINVVSSDSSTYASSGRSGRRVQLAPSASSTAVRCRPGPSTGVTARPSCTYRRQNTWLCRSNALSGSYTRRYDANSVGTARSSHGLGPRDHIASVPSGGPRPPLIATSARQLCPNGPGEATTSRQLCHGGTHYARIYQPHKGESTFPVGEDNGCLQLQP